MTRTALFVLTIVATALAFVMPAQADNFDDIWLIAFGEDVTASGKQVIAYDSSFAEQASFPRISSRTGRAIYESPYTGLIYDATSDSGGEVREFDPDTRTQTGGFVVGGRNFNGVLPIPNGNLLLSDNGGTIFEYTTGGGLVGTFRSGLSRPFGLDMLPDGTILVADNTSLRRFSADGTTELTAIANGGIRRVKVGPDGNIYYTDTGNNAMLVRDTSGALLGTYSMDSNEAGLDFDTNGVLYVLDGRRLERVNVSNLASIVEINNPITWTNDMSDVALVTFPEPGTLVLVGLGGLMILRRRRV